MITQTQDIMTGVLVGNDVKETQTQNSKGGNEKESLQKGCLKINETGKKGGNQKLLPYTMIPKNATVSEITTSYKQVIGWDTTFIS